METRIEGQVRVYVLVLNTFGSAEDSCIAAVSFDYDKIVKQYTDDLLPEGFRDEMGFFHSFPESSPFYRLNPCFDLELNHVNHWGQGIHDEWVPISAIDEIRSRYYFID
jgi:hypothetical protein